MPQANRDPRRINAHVTLVRAETEMVLADCEGRVDARRDQQVTEARGVAQRFRKVVASHEQLRDAIPSAVAIDEEALPLISKAWETLALMLEKLWDCFVDFKAEHGALLEPDLETRLREACSWTVDQVEAIRPALHEYERKLARDLEHASAELRELAQDWSAVDGDGLEADA